MEKSNKIKRSLVPVQILLIFVMIFSCMIVVGMLSAKALEKQRQATALNQAAIWAANAADVFYASDNAAELAAILGGDVHGKSVIVKLGKEQLGPNPEISALRINLSTEGNYMQAEISVRSIENKVFSLECRKYIGDRRAGQ